MTVVSRTLLVFVAGAALCRAETPAPQDDRAAHDYPTAARVEYVQECMLKNGGELSFLYKCSCAIDQIATKLTYDDFVEWGTFARNASLAGERSGVFRDSDEAKENARKYRTTEADAFKACGLPASQ